MSVIVTVTGSKAIKAEKPVEKKEAEAVKPAPAPKKKSAKK